MKYKNYVTQAGKIVDKRHVIRGTEGNQATVKIFQSSYKHGYASPVIGEGLGRIDNPILLGYELFMIGYLSPSAQHDSENGTRIILDKQPKEDLILRVEHKGGIFERKLIKNRYTKRNWYFLPRNVRGEDTSIWVYQSGDHGEDWFQLDQLQKGDEIKVTLMREVLGIPVLWDDSLLFDDADTWQDYETVEGHLLEV